MYVGKGYVIHLAPPSEHAHAGAGSMMSVLQGRATVKKEKLCVVVGDNKYRINNTLDEKYEPRSVKEILEDAHSLLNKEIPYSVFTRNCEHFVIELRYGKPESRQVRDALMAVDAVAGVWTAISAAYAIVKCLDLKDKEEQAE
ncbi:phospholipase A and acyltransferase 3 [Labeo rohita]|nr:phospholipase A and acyltransferase 3 [Labeo rohita]